MVIIPQKAFEVRLRLFFENLLWILLVWRCSDYVTLSLSLYAEDISFILLSFVAETLILKRKLLIRVCIL
jgi:hypothetical protein